MANKLGTFGKFSAAYRPFGVLRRVLGPLGNVGTFYSGYQDYKAMRSGEIGTGRFAWRIGGGLASIGVSTYIGGQFGGPWGAAAGTAVGVSSFAGEKAYDGFMYWYREMSKVLGNTENALRTAGFQDNNGNKTNFFQSYKNAEDSDIHNNPLFGRLLAPQI